MIKPKTADDCIKIIDQVWVNPMKKKIDELLAQIEELEDRLLSTECEWEQQVANLSDTLTEMKKENDELRNRRD